MSAQSQLLGLFPVGLDFAMPTTLNTTIVPLKIDNLDSMMMLLDNNALRGRFQPIPISEVEEDKDFLLRGHDAKTCPRQNQIYEEVKNSAAYQANKTNYDDNYKDAVEAALGMNFGFHNAKHVGDTLMTELAAGFPLPAGITQDLYDETVAIFNYSMNMMHTDEGLQL